MRLGPYTVRANAGMFVAAGLLVVGAALYLGAPDDREGLSLLGLGLLVLSSIVYLGARVVMMVGDRVR